MEHTEKDELVVRHRNLQNKLYMMLIEILGIFGIPAVLAFFIGRSVDTQMDTTGHTATIVLLVIAFVTSWIILIRRVRTISKELKNVEQELKERNSQKV